VPTKIPDREGYQSYQMSNLIAAPFMMGWKDFSNEHIDIYKSGVESKSKLKVFLNQTLGEPWEERKEQIKKNQLAKNTRRYEVGSVPSKLSEDDGNGNIIMLTCACDLNGTIDDARLDWEVVAHSSSASWYSIKHGSIGSYYPGNKDQNRDKLTYRNGMPNNVWDIFHNEVISAEYFDDDGNQKEIVMTAIDTGYMTHEAYRFINAHSKVIGVKGREYEDGRKITTDTKLFKPASERPDLYILEVELLKDKLAEMISLPKKKPQIPGFMNFPIPSDGTYTVPGYFVQYEAEQKQVIENEDGEALRWKWVNPKKKHNHFFDVAVYNLALRDIISFLICKELKIPHGGWDYFCGIMDRIE
jgi:phage terminase large subunit GpA-like protein